MTGFHAPQDRFLPHRLSLVLPPSLSPSLSFSLSRFLPPSLSPSLPFSLSSFLPPSLFPSLSFSLSRFLPPSLSPSLPFSLSPFLPPSLSPSLSFSKSNHSRLNAQIPSSLPRTRKQRFNSIKAISAAYFGARATPVGQLSLVKGWG